ncbi:DUF1077-domain-containing protein [Metschnikowia bicuspidata var. bicuspidata NRRL YB-4993]|uniref:ER membrane protein complex subunit 4 n=1 Tax=Metschnikowia bicuspidata var. bicuspidata NRRL YB-4993 TaxID=869754 RepID=A0A1A0HHM1_9ASCO|nr:DUF1077-domain-containing protein [Metschnikowia bicuspidata var. bicuspidata NRRL YB-4993]OBA23377.1 DUF1077-domain-containing protein [Metschnikowia bicuspidata var. bicuspidata NRRL YB-4993]
MTGDIPSPPGFEQEAPRLKKSDRTEKNEHTKKPTQKELDLLKVKKAWDIATMPAKNIPMNLVMSYMTGNSLQVIPIMMTLMLLWNPLKAILTETNSVFAGFTTNTNSLQMYLPKIVFVSCQLANMMIGLWKLNKLGLIPNKEADWLSWQVAGEYIEKLSF